VVIVVTPQAWLSPRAMETFHLVMTPGLGFELVVGEV
jgi:hypothetical protein